MDYSKFTDRARQVMLLAHREARKKNHDWVSPAHVLVGLVSEGIGMAAHVLKGFGLAEDMVDQVRKVAAFHEPDGPASVGLERDIRPTMACENLVLLALEEAANLGHGHVGTEHLLLGLLRQEEGVGYLVIKDLGLDKTAVRKRVLDLLDCFKSPWFSKDGKLIDFSLSEIIRKMIDVKREHSDLCDRLENAKAAVGELERLEEESWRTRNSLLAELEKALAVEARKHE